MTATGQDEPVTATVAGLVVAALPPSRAEAVLDAVAAPDPVEPDRVARADLAVALHVVLLADLADRVPSAGAYLDDARREQRPVHLDHAAVRTVAWPAGPLPPGRDQVGRVLEPLGYRRHATYDLARLHMTGFAYAHLDRPEAVPQWFVSELHPDDFTAGFREVVGRILAASVDPLDEVVTAHLDHLTDHGDLPRADAVALLDPLVAVFGRHHPLPTERDHQVLAAESAEMAWIATEGTACNHCTDRVPDVEEAADRERVAGRPIKESVEVSASGRVRQTAHRAATVVRSLPTMEGDPVPHRLPGSFFELISRDRLPDGHLDLAFDAANATGIFAMTRPAGSEAP